MTDVAPNLDFWQWFQALPGDDRMELVGAVLVAVVAFTAIICYLINSIHRRRADLQLKRDLLERGMPADEIATVIRATPGKGKAIRHKIQPTGGHGT